MKALYPRMASSVLSGADINVTAFCEQHKNRQTGMIAVFCRLLEEKTFPDHKVAFNYHDWSEQSLIAGKDKPHLLIVGPGLPEEGIKIFHTDVVGDITLEKVYDILKKNLAEQPS